MQQNHVKEKMQKLLSNQASKFEKLCISLEEYNKSKINAHEIYFNNIMYDVKSAKICGERVLLSVIADYEEGNIIQKIKNYFAVSNKQDNKIPDNLSKFLTLVYILPEINFSFLVQENYNKVFKSFFIKFLCFNPEVLTPPPRGI